MNDRFRGLFRAGAAILLVVPTGAQAYIGPGAGIGVIGTVIAFLGAVLLAIVAFVWYPIKRLLRRKQAPQARDEQQPGAKEGEEEGVEEAAEEAAER